MSEDHNYLLEQLNRFRTFIGKEVTKGLEKLNAQGQRLGRQAIILDTGSKISIFRDQFLFEHIRDSNNPIIVDGINTDAEGLLILQEGMTEFGIVYYDPRASANVLSFSASTRVARHLWVLARSIFI